MYSIIIVIYKGWSNTHKYVVQCTCGCYTAFYIIPIDLKGIDLKGIDLKGIDLKGLLCNVILGFIKISIFGYFSIPIIHSLLCNNILGNAFRPIILCNAW